MDTTPENPDQPTPEQPTPVADRIDSDDHGNPGPEKWVREAIAEQEEHIKRQTSCMGTLGRAHTFRAFGTPGPDHTIAKAATYEACIVCGVTRTNEDYHRQLGT